MAVLLLQLGGGGGGRVASDLLGCLGSLVMLTLLSISSYLALRLRKRTRSGKEGPDFTSLRSTGKTVVNEEPDDEDSNPPGGVN